MTTLHFFLRFALVAVMIGACVVHSFTASPTQYQGRALLVSRLQATENEKKGGAFASKPPGSRGVSIDQDGKSNVWAIEPKVEVSIKSSEETSQSALVAVGSLTVFAGLAFVALSNLPDPNQF